MFFYIKALHIIFIVTWFSGLFYIVRLFIYITEAQSRSEHERDLLAEQLKIMASRLWYGITWPSAVLTLVFGWWMLHLYGSFPQWLILKLCFVIGLYAYHLSLQFIYSKILNNVFPLTSQQLRVWNELATVFLIAIVMLVVVKNSISLLWGMVGLVVLMIVLLLAVRVYKLLRS